MFMPSFLLFVFIFELFVCFHFVRTKQKKQPQFSKTQKIFKDIKVDIKTVGQRCCRIRSNEIALIKDVLAKFGSIEDH